MTPLYKKIIVDGDIAEVQEWVGWGIAKAKQIHASGMPHFQGNYVPTDGVTVNIKYNRPLNMAWIFVAGGGYMESGILDLRSMALLTDSDFYRPALLRFSSYVSGLIADHPNAGGRTVVDGSESYTASGATAKRNTVKLFSSPTDDFTTTPDVIEAGKQVMNYVPSSMYTGLMKLYVQALYGSKRTDYRRNVAVGLYGAVEVAMKDKDTLGELVYLTLGHQMSTSGLILAGDEYKLIQMGTSSVTMRSMVRVGGAVSKTVDDTASRAYTLAALTPANTAMLLGDISAYTEGWSPLHYGWHFNRAGNEASIVLTAPKVINGLLPAGTAGSITGLQTKLLTVRFSYDATGGVSYTVTVGATGDYIPFVQSRIFIPARSDTGSDIMSVVTPSSSTPWIVYADLTAPVYCYYDDEDELQVITAHCGARTAEAATPPWYHPAVDDRHVGVIFGGVTWREYQEFEGTQKPALTKFGAAGFSSPSFNFVGGGYTSSGTTIYGKYMLRASLTPWASPPPSGEAGLNQPFGATRVAPWHNTLEYGTDVTNTSRVGVTKTSDSENNIPVFVIPFDDAAAVIVGLQTTRSGTLGSVGCIAGRVDSVAYRYEPSGYMNPNAGSVFGYAAPGEMLFNSAARGGSTWMFRGSYTPPDAAGFQDSHALENSCASQLHLFTANQSASLSSYSRRSTSNAEAFADRPFSGLFEVTAIAPRYNAGIYVRSSFGGSVRYDVPGASGQVDWPVPSNPSSAVGWA